MDGLIAKKVTPRKMGMSLNYTDDSTLSMRRPLQYFFLQLFSPLMAAE